MIKKLFPLFILLSLCLITSVNAKTIVWVAEDQDQDNNGIKDSQDWVDKLTAAGYTVDFRPAYWNTFTSALRDEINNTADLVIVSCTTQSGTFTGTGETALWNSVSKPMILCSPYIARSNRWQWINYGVGTLPNNNGDDGSPIMQVTAPGHPIFTGVTLDAGNQLQAADPAKYTGNCTFLATNNPGNGTLIAKTVPTSLVQDWSWIIEWPQGTTFYSGSSYTATNRRMYFTGIGAKEVLNSGLYPMRGYNLTDQGWKLFLNAVKYMLGDLQTGTNPYASIIYPADGQVETPVNAILSWIKGSYAAAHNVYLSTNFDDVNTAQATAWVSHYQSGTTYNPGALANNTTYYWRIDEVNSPGTAGSPFYKGSVWTFTTDLSGYPIGYADSPMGIDRITPTASSRLNTAHDPNKTIGINNTGLAQGLGAYKAYYVDANHTTEAANNMWLTEPNDPKRWIQYVFDKEYKLNDILVWNYNETTELASYGIFFSKFGIKDVNIATTTDYGTGWSSPMLTQLKRATELPTYQAIDPLNGNSIGMGGTIVTGVKLNAINNWSTEYTGYGLSEVMFLVAPTYASNYTVTTGNKNTTVNTSTAAVDPNMPNNRLNWKKGRDSGVFASSHKLYIQSIDNDAVTNVTPADPNSARNAVRDNTIAALTTTDPNYPLSGLNMQATYYWRVDEVIDARTWMNNSTRNNYKDIQSFKTVGSRLVTNFEAQSSLIGGGIFVSSPVHGGSVAFRVPIDKTSGNIELGPVDPIYYNINSHNWQPGNPTMLVLYFYGDPNNTGVSMYVKLGSTKIVYGANPAQEDISLIKRAAWSRWNVPLTGITLSNVLEISYGVDISGGTGLGQIVFDDLTLYRIYPPAPVPTHPNDANLIAYYNFNGSNANDSSGNNRNGTPRGTVTYPASTIGTIFEKVMDVNGGNTNFVDLGLDPAFNDPPGSLSIAFWTYIRTWSGTGAVDWAPAMIGCSRDNNSGWQIRRNSTNNNLEFDAAVSATLDGSGANTGYMYYVRNGSVLPTNQWIHVACVFDSENLQMYMYINGSDVSVRQSGTIGLSKMLAAKTGNDYHKTTIGGRITAAGGAVTTADRTLNGQMDEVRLYNKALTASEVLYLSNPAPATIVK